MTVREAASLDAWLTGLDEQAWDYACEETSLCADCGRPTAAPAQAYYYDPVNPTDGTLRTVCDECAIPRDAGIDYAAAFQDEGE